LAICALLCIGMASGCALYDGLTGDLENSSGDARDGDKDAGADSGDVSAVDADDLDGRTTDSDESDADEPDADREDIFEEDTTNSDAESPDAGKRCETSDDCGAGICGKIRNRCTYPRAISAGYSHTCVLFTNGSIRCWGNNANGQLGRPISEAASPVPKVVRFEEFAGPAIAISAGGYHTCAIIEPLSPVQPRTVYCWGNNGSGQLGNGTMTSSATPVEVDLSALEQNEEPLRIAAGYDHTCMSTDVGHVYCWGLNDVAQLGVGADIEPPAQLLTPTTRVISSSGSELRDIRGIATHIDHTCAVDKFQKMYCWGKNSKGQIGIDSKEMTIPYAIQPSWGMTNLPAGNFFVNHVAIGLNHTCAVVSSSSLPVTGDVYCWGGNLMKQLGAVAETPLLHPQSWSLRNARAVAAGDQFTCAINKDYNVLCWGRNDRGQLGRGETGSAMAIDQDDPVNDSWDDVERIDAGAAHACALRGNHEIWCWGLNVVGQLGVELGDAENDCSRPATCSSNPVRVEF
jgi:alpha-tubulin suppressor-like RCC1 family protein